MTSVRSRARQAHPPARPSRGCRRCDERASAPIALTRPRRVAPAGARGFRHGEVGIEIDGPESRLAPGHLDRGPESQIGLVDGGSAGSAAKSTTCGVSLGCCDAEGTADQRVHRRDRVIGQQALQDLPAHQARRPRHQRGAGGPRGRAMRRSATVVVAAGGPPRPRLPPPPPPASGAHAVDAGAGRGPAGRRLLTRLTPFMSRTARHVGAQRIHVARHAVLAVVVDGPGARRAAAAAAAGGRRWPLLPLRCDGCCERPRGGGRRRCRCAAAVAAAAAVAVAVARPAGLRCAGHCRSRCGRCRCAAAAAAARLAGLVLVLADALHHLAARGLGGGVHDFAAAAAARAAPEGLAAHGDGLGLLARLGAEAFDHLRGDVAAW